MIPRIQPPHPCSAPSKSAGFGSKQNYAKPTTFFLKPPSHPASGRVPQPRDSHFQTLRSSARFTETERSRAAFTLIELMAATTVLSVILLMMVGMQDQMSKAWANANRRTDATREARSAAILMAADLTCPIFRSPTIKSKKDQFADSLINKGLPFVYSSNGTGSGLSISNIQSGSSCLFFVTPKKITSTNNPSDLALVGYYVGQTNSKNIYGFKTTNLNLYRYYVPNPSTQLSTWFANPTSASLNTLFTAIEANSEILARNVANLQILFYNEGTNPIEGMNYANTTSMGTIYRGNKIQVSLTLYPEDAAQKFTSLASWTDSNNITKFSRSFEFRVDCWRD